jgi:hypothetical protein
MLTLGLGVLVMRVGSGAIVSEESIGLIRAEVCRSNQKYY